MMAYILGRPETDLLGEKAVLPGYSLGIQHLEQTPDKPSPKLPKSTSVQDLLRKNWGDNFRSYALFPNPLGKVSGMLWSLNSKDLGLIRHWELVNYGWYEEIKVSVKTQDGKKHQATTVRIQKGQDLEQIIDDDQYRAWLQEQELYKIATSKSRLDFYQNQKRSNSSVQD